MTRHTLHTLFVLLFFSRQILAKCPLNAIESELYNACYIYVPIQSSWTAAEQICNLRGGHLPSIHSEAQNEFILQSVLGVNLQNASTEHINTAYIGALEVKGAWTWTDGSPFDFSNFIDTKDYAPGTVSNIIKSGPVKENVGDWVSQQIEQMNSNFICQLPRCDSNGKSAQPLISPNSTSLVLSYLDSTQSWYYSSYYEKVTQTVAERECTAIGGHLPSVHNVFQNSELLNLMKDWDKSPFIFFWNFGLTTDDNGQNWQWYDGSAVGYTNWHAGEPKNYSGRAYTYLYSDGTWASDLEANDYSLNSYVCQFRTNINFCQ